MPIQTKNPTTEEAGRVFDEVTDPELERKLALAVEAFQNFRQTSFSERATLMRKLGDYLRGHKEEFGQVGAKEMGKTVGAGAAEAEKCATLCDYYAEHAEKFLAHDILVDANAENYVAFEPLGAVLAVMPWNFPFWQVYRFAVPALMAGNVGLLKHASNVPECALLIEKSFETCGFPKGVFQNLFLSSARVEKVIRDPRIAAVTLTGSEKAGSEVAKVAGQEIKKTVLELGGSDPYIVFADADVKFAAKVCVEARLQKNAGQSCISAKRFIVETNIQPEFEREVVALAEKLVVGDPLDEKTDVGPLATENILKDVEAQVEKSVAMGARVLYGGKRANERGYFYLPTILSNVSPEMPVLAEEVFGPVMPIIAFKTEEEAIKIANDTRYGLGAAIFTKDIDKARRLIGKIEAGNVFVNSMVHSDPKAPFGGVKKSGFGRELGSYGIREFVNQKHVLIKKI